MTEHHILNMHCRRSTVTVLITKNQYDLLRRLLGEDQSLDLIDGGNDTIYHWITPHTIQNEVKP